MQKQKRVSYIRKPHAKRALLSLGLAGGALVLGILGIASSVITGGQAQLNAAAVCFCSLVTAIASIVYGVLSFFESDRKYVLAKIGLTASGALVIFWAALIIIGIKG